MKYKPKVHRISGRRRFMVAEDSFQHPEGKLLAVNVSKHAKAKGPGNRKRQAIGTKKR